ncbi:hypothetical protein IQ241_06370 [Romeria aff. gracilis LEGE 07310]|uniref:Biotin carboxylase n=1 Tax=Vasconcelosia minhoensis LEGE 07310 TaxID=915328 RepID=A0A8J7A5P0_9CYAN|nr:hypothetical protein [Romeria gracilis]MBE9076922.1 hypothetical protein [Romeria aff. gracilis LEGE 07310]
MRRQALITVLFAACFWLLGTLAAPSAYAITQIELQDLTSEQCPEDAAYADGLVGSGSSIDATCYLIHGKAVNSSGRPVVDADVFGRIYDANDNPVMKNRFRLGGIDYVPPGESDFEFRVSIPSNQKPPMQLRQFKASGFTGKVR